MNNMIKKINICVFCGSMRVENIIYVREAKKLGNIFQRINGIYFWRWKKGLMGAIARRF